AMIRAREVADWPPWAFGLGAPLTAAWYSASNTCVPNSARMRVRGPLPTRTYQTALPRRVTCRCRCGGRGRGMATITGRYLQFVQDRTPAFLWMARSVFRLCLRSRCEPQLPPHQPASPRGWRGRYQPG